MARASKQAGPGCLIGFGAFFAGMGALFLFFIAGDFLKNLVTYGWEERPCSYDSVEIAVDGSDRDSPFQLSATYRYRFQGQEYLSSQVARSGAGGTDSYQKLALKRKSLLAAGEGVCWVNPEQPSEAVLERRAWQSGLLMLFPLPFIAIGIGIIIGGIKGKQKEKSGALSEGVSRGGGRKVAIGMGALFLVIGLAMLWPIGIRPIREMIDSKGWVATPCKIVWSRVREHRGDDSTTYSPDIFYRYEFNGETHHSNRHGIMGGSSSGRSSKQQIVKQYPKGSQRTCYVDPDLPERAVLKVGVTGAAAFGLIPLLFALAGGAVLIGGLRSKRRQGDATPRAVEDEALTGPRVLEPGSSRRNTFFVLLAVALFWNGILLIPLTQEEIGWESLFFVPFLLIGILLLAGVAYLAGGLFNPKPVITLLPGDPILGERMALAWSIPSGEGRLSDLGFYLQGEETARFQNGKNTSWRGKVFYAVQLAEVGTVSEMRSGQLTFDLPADLVPTLDLSSNKIRWHLIVKGSVPLWPDVVDRYEVKVLAPQLTNP